MKNPSDATTGFEPEFIAGLKLMFEERIAFNKVLGMQITGIAPERVGCRIAMRPELVGNFHSTRIHGGVISSVLDALGGLAVLAAVSARHLDEAIPQRLQRFAKLGTIDLRVDYLRPGIGEHFDATATALRAGSRVGTARMDFHDPAGKLIATATGAYILS